ncbi:unnamed protein product [Phyllotreta striolata]|uniref:F-box/LRR-repeat protein 15-like leucin rich repeat domain-containing protein n=1 Tax=Phyllotreta striolata TaxID=444603 RepID=A0A9N9XRD4_PHYSR|nr:unnamed protein product [Phyllotreta striolata]
MNKPAHPWQRPISSLYSLTLEYVVNNLNVYVNENDDRISALPHQIKNRLLKKFTATSRFMHKKVNFKTALKSIVNKQTSSINLLLADIDDDVLHIIGTCENVKDLYLSGIDASISTKGLIRLLENCHNLVTFILSECPAINDAVLECIADNCPNINGLDINGSSVTDAGIKKLSNLKRLRCINLSATKITDEGIVHLVKGPSGSVLKELIIENAEISEFGLRQIAEHCPNLEVLSFYNIDKRDDATCPTFSSELKNLKQLSWTVVW